MPTKATVSGVMQDANLDPVAGGKVIAKFNGSDYFDNGIKIVTQTVEATTDELGEWSMDLIVNSEGDNDTTSWTIEGYNQFVAKVFTAANLFIATSDPIKLSDLEQLSAANLAAARNEDLSRFIIVNSFTEYEGRPEDQKEYNDVIMIVGGA